jgi:alanine or glycine:cation symporter, AGCS family
VLFALFAAIAAFGIGNMVQSNSVADAINTSFGVPPMGDRGSSSRCSPGGHSRRDQVDRPVHGVLRSDDDRRLHARRAHHPRHQRRGDPGSFTYIFTERVHRHGGDGRLHRRDADAAGIRYGVARGIFSNESGLGTAGIAAAAAQTREPARRRSCP